MAEERLRAAVRRGLRLAAGSAGEQSDGELLRAYLAANCQAAFGALVNRHGRLVLGVCRRILGNHHDAEDAFQATFILLARRASSVRRHESLGSWLHGVAYRTATNAKRAASRRRRHESRALPAPAAPTPADVDWREFQVLLDEEVRRLPEVYRAAFVLCCLECKPAAQVARELGVKEGTVWGRVAKARELLRDRLSARGVALSALAGAVTLSDAGVWAAVPSSLVDSTVEAADLVAAGLGVAGVVSPQVAALVKGVTRAMLLTTKVKVATGALLAACALAGVLGRASGFGGSASTRNAETRDHVAGAPERSGRIDPDLPGGTRQASQRAGEAQSKREGVPGAEPKQPVPGAEPKRGAGSGRPKQGEPGAEPKRGEGGQPK
jgi:RNA polymerase sigma factor (sigma-70 family)